MLKYLVIAGVLAVVVFAIATYQAPEKEFERTNITFQGFEPDEYGDCKKTCKSTCPSYGWLYRGYRYEVTGKECICFCLKEV